MPGNPFKGAWSRLSLKKLNRVPTLCEDDIQTIQMCLDREVVDVHRLSNEDFLREWELSEVPKEVVDAAIDPHQLAVMAAHAWKVQAAKRATEKGKGSVGSSSGGKTIPSTVGATKIPPIVIKPRVNKGNSPLTKVLAQHGVLSKGKAMVAPCSPYFGGGQGEELRKDSTPGITPISS